MTKFSFLPKPRPPVIDGIDFNRAIEDGPALTDYVEMESG